MSIKTWNSETQSAEPLVPGAIEKEHYSTEEVKTNKTWIDGKPIYRKVIKTNIGAAEDFRTIDLNTSFEDIVSAFVTIKDSNGAIYPLINETRSIGGGMYNIGFFVGGNGYRLINTLVGTLQIVMEYTKQD